MKALPWLLVVLLTLAVLFLWSHQPESPTLSGPDTVDYVETIPFYKPIPKDSVVIRYKYAKLPVKKDTCSTKGDTCTASVDSAEVEIPITQKVYEDSLYRAWVSGYDVKLDSIKVNSRTREIKIPVPVKPKRWGLGLQVGYGGTVNRSSPYIGIGISYNLFQW